MQKTKRFIVKLKSVSSKGQALVEYAFLASIFTGAVLLGIASLSIALQNYYTEKTAGLEHMEATVVAYQSCIAGGGLSSECAQGPREEVISAGDNPDEGAGSTEDNIGACYNKTPDEGSFDLASQQAATSYRFSQVSQNLPTGCAFTSVVDGTEEYVCSAAVTLAQYDSVIIDEVSPVNITFDGVFITGANTSINPGGASNLNIHAIGVVTIGANTVINANVSSTAAVNIGAMVNINGNLSTSTPTGVITIGEDFRTTGFVKTTHGAITLGARGTIGGAIISEHGVMTLATETQAYELISGAGAVTTEPNSSICKDVRSTGAGVVTLTGTKVGGNVITGAGAATLTGSSVGESVTVTGAGVVTLTDTPVGGNVTTTAGAVTVTGGSVGESVTSTGAGVVTLTNVPVGGEITTIAGAVTVTGGSVGESVTVTGAGVVTLTNSEVGGNVTTIDGAITLTNTPVGGVTESTGAGVITVTP
jgi:hypothetical protein